jgi:signal transduction histidine kinase
VTVRRAFLHEFRAHGAPTGRVERVLAVGRAVLTVTGLIAIYLDPNEPVRLATLTYAVLLSYAVYSLVVVAALQTMPRVEQRHAAILHGLDVAWTAALTIVSEGPVSPFFLFFLFVVVAAAYRWGFVETLGTALLIVVVFLVESLFVGAGPWHPTWLQSTDLDLNSAILRVTYLLLTGFLLGYLSEQEKRFRAETAAVASASQQPRVDLGVAGSVHAVATLLLRVFDAAALALVLREHESGRGRVWRLHRALDSTTGEERPARELTPSEDAEWLFADQGRVWHAVLPESGARAATRWIATDGAPLERGAVDIPAVVRGPEGTRSVTTLNMALPGEWDGRVYLYDMPAGRTLERRLHLLSAMGQQIAAALTNVFLLQRLRSEVSAAERARVAREIHDGAIQALIGIQMSVQAMRRIPPEPAVIDREFAHIEGLLQREVLSLRELMQALRPIQFDASESLADVLGGAVERFRRDSGVSARFIGIGEPVRVDPTRALELMRITQEALMNVRRHSGARNVLVRLSKSGHRCELSIEDDGRGFQFTGHLTGPELDAHRLGPAVIKERARVVGADLVVESFPDEGARIRLQFEDGGRG